MATPPSYISLTMAHFPKTAIETMESYTGVMAWSSLCNNLQGAALALTITRARNPRRNHDPKRNGNPDPDRNPNSHSTAQSNQTVTEFDPRKPFTILLSLIPILTPTLSPTLTLI